MTRGYCLPQKEKNGKSIAIYTAGVNAIPAHQPFVMPSPLHLAEADGKLGKNRGS